jgi:hypothetical protein
MIFTAFVKLRILYKIRLLGNGKRVQEEYNIVKIVLIQYLINYYLIN